MKRDKQSVAVTRRDHTPVKGVGRVSAHQRGADAEGTRLRRGGHENLAQGSPAAQMVGHPHVGKEETNAEGCAHIHNMKNANRGRWVEGVPCITLCAFWYVFSKGRTHASKELEQLAGVCLYTCMSTRMHVYVCVVCACGVSVGVLHTRVLVCARVSCTWVVCVLIYVHLYV